VVSTNALELGIDVGTLDAVIISGYPGTMISTWQQAGRAGRGLDESLAILIAFQNPLDQYFMNHPSMFFSKPHEHAIIDVSNPYIRAGHLICAAAEFPLDLDRVATFFGEESKEIVANLGKKGILKETRHGWAYAGRNRVTNLVQLNNISSEIFTILHEGSLLETMDRMQAFREAHEGAVLLHQGETYIVTELDLEKRIARVKKVAVDYHTEPLRNEQVQVIEERDSRTHGDLTIHYGELEISIQYYSYRIVEKDMVRGYQDLNLPEIRFRTKGFWISIPDEIQDKLLNQNLDLAGGLHGLEHALIGMMPFHVLCDRWDIGGLSTPFHEDTFSATIFIYDACEGGIGLSEKAFQLFEDILKVTHELVRDCKCELGCPACILSPKCGNENQPMDKKATIEIARYLLDKMRT
ncbi:MAG: DEAD/DEAH box helicase, partial [Candidatus Helarchaeales archaeon]